MDMDDEDDKLDRTREIGLFDLDYATKRIFELYQPSLVQYSGAMIGKRYDIATVDFIIGRERSCDAIIKDESKTVSRRHAEITKRDDGYYITDLNSFNGTWVNRERIKEVKLKDGDLIKVGSVITLKFLFSGGSAEKEFLDEIYKRATIDALTQIFNKKYFLENLEMEIKNAKTGNGQLCLVMFDIDYFKNINDTHGHQAGDYVLRTLCDITKNVIRADDIFARYGGEEFVILFIDTSRDNIFRQAERIRKTVETYMFLYDNEDIPVTISLGVSWLESNMDSKELIRIADEKLYYSKATGRNKVTI